VSFVGVVRHDNTGPSGFLHQYFVLVHFEADECQLEADDAADFDRQLRQPVIERLAPRQRAT